MAKQKIRDLAPYELPYGVYNRFNEYFNLLLNSVKIVGTDDSDINFAEETFAKTALFDRGAVGYDKVTKKWYYVYGMGLNELGNPTGLSLVAANGVSFYRDAYYDKNEEGAYLIKALPSAMSMSELIKEATDFMTNCDIAMRQNLEACKTPYIVVCRNKDMQLSFEQALQQKILGQACIIVNEELGEGLKAVNIGVNYLVDQFGEARDKERDILLNKLGIMTANINKKERVQSAEVNATIGQATDYIYLLIDTFNKQCTSYDLPFKMVLNGSLEEIYLKGVNDVDANDAEQMQKGGAEQV